MRRLLVMLGALAALWGAMIAPAQAQFGSFLINSPGGLPAPYFGPGDITAHAFSSWWSCTRAYDRAVAGSVACDLERESDSAVCTGVRTLKNGNLDVAIGTYCGGQTVRAWAAGTIAHVIKEYDQAGGGLHLTATGALSTAPILTFGAVNGQPSATCSAHASTILNNASIPGHNTPITFAVEAERTGTTGSFTFAFTSDGDSVGVTFDNTPNRVHFDANGALPLASAQAEDNLLHSFIGTSNTASSSFGVDGYFYPGTQGTTQVGSNISICADAVDGQGMTGYVPEAGYVAAALDSQTAQNLAVNMDAYYVLTNPLEIPRYVCLTNIFVNTPANGGTSSGPGTNSGNAFDTIQNAFSNTVGGIQRSTCVDVVVGSGSTNTYSGNFLFPANSGGAIEPNGWIWIQATDSSGTPVDVTHGLTPTQTSRAKLIGTASDNTPTVGTSSTTTLQYVGVRGFEITSNGDDPDSSCVNFNGTNAWGAPNTWGPRGVAVIYNYPHDCPAAGIAILAGEMWWVTGNYVPNTASRSPFAQSGITLAVPRHDPTTLFTAREAAMPWKILTARNTIFNPMQYASPYFSRTDGECIIYDDFASQQDAGSGPTNINSGLYKYPSFIGDNVLFNCGGYGIELNSTYYVTVAYNTVLSAGQDLAENNTGRLGICDCGGDFNQVYGNIVQNFGPYTSIITSLSADSDTIHVNDYRGVTQFLKNIAVAITMVWEPDNGGQITIVAATPAPVAEVGDVVFIGGATNAGTGGDAAVFGNFTVTAFIDNQHFIVAAPAAAGVITTIGGTPAINPFSEEQLLLSPTNPLPVFVNGTLYEAVGYTADVSNVSTLQPGGSSGSITFSTNVLQADGQQYNVVQPQTALNKPGGCTGPGAAQVPCSFAGYNQSIVAGPQRGPTIVTCSGVVTTPPSCPPATYTALMGDDRIYNNLSQVTQGGGSFQGLNASVAANTFGSLAKCPDGVTIDLSQCNKAGDPDFTSPDYQTTDVTAGSGTFGPGFLVTGTLPDLSLIAAISPAVGYGSTGINPANHQVFCIPTDITGKIRNCPTPNAGAYESTGTPLAFTGIADAPGAPEPLLCYMTFACTKTIATGRQPAFNVNCNGDPTTIYTINITLAAVLDDAAIETACPGWEEGPVSFTATISTTTMSVSAIASGLPAIGQIVSGTSVTTGSVITACPGDVCGGTGDYTLSHSSTVASGETMTAVNLVHVARAFEQIQNQRQCDLVMATAATQPTLLFNNVHNKDVLSFSGTQYLQLNIVNGDPACGEMFATPSLLTVAVRTFGTGTSVFAGNDGSGSTNIGMKGANLGWFQQGGTELTETLTDGQYGAIISTGNPTPGGPTVTGFLDVNNTFTPGSFGGNLWDTAFAWGAQPGGTNGGSGFSPGVAVYGLPFSSQAEQLLPIGVTGPQATSIYCHSLQPNLALSPGC